MDQVVHEFTLRFSLPEHLDASQACQLLARAGIDDMVVGMGAAGMIAMVFDRPGRDRDAAMEGALVEVMEALPGASGSGRDRFPQGAVTRACGPGHPA